MNDLHEAYEDLKKRNPLKAALLTSRELYRSTEAGLAMIERALPTAADYRELRVVKPKGKGNPDDAEN